MSEQSYCARCNCRRYRNAEGGCEVCALYQAKRAELVSLVAKWRERANADEYKLHREWAIDQCADELEAALARTAGAQANLKRTVE